jgi:hypothetical protein
MNKLEDVLGEQDSFAATTLVTIERIKGDDECVRVVPFVDGPGCACEQSFRVKKADIEVVEAKGTHRCCGKLLRVLRVKLEETAQVPLKGLIDEALTRARTRSHDGSLPPRPVLGGCQRACLEDFNGCLEACDGDDDCIRACDQSYGNCVQDCMPGPRSLRRSATPRALACNCQALQDMLQSLQEALQDAPTPHKAALVKMINRVLTQMGDCGC